MANREQGFVFVCFEYFEDQTKLKLVLLLLFCHKQIPVLVYTLAQNFARKCKLISHPRRLKGRLGWQMKDIYHI